MKKIWIVIFAAFIVFVVYASFVNTVYTTSVLINEPYTKVLTQLSDIRNIAKWYLPFANNFNDKLVVENNNKIKAGNTALELDKIDASGNWLNVTQGNIKKTVLFNFAADTGKTTRVNLHYENTLLNEITKRNKIIENAKMSLENFSAYFTDSKKMYGYTIEISKVSDTAFLFTSGIAANADKKKTIRALYEKLIDKSKVQHNEYNGTRIFYSSHIGTDSVQLFTGIGITNTTLSNITGDIIIKRMPFKMNLINTFYQGSFAEINKALDALAQFKADNNLVSMAIPFIKFITEGTEFSDEEIIQAIACYPIF